MEGQNKHFSHTHNLNLHQLPEGTQITCSGCNSSGTGIVYACWQCNFILHEQCYHASRSLKHPSHPTHPLALLPYPTYPSNSFYCNSCSQVGTGFSYSCPDCEFDLHVNCAFTIPKSAAITPNAHITPLPNQPIPNVDPITNPFPKPCITGSPSKSDDQHAKVKTLGIKHFSHSHALNLMNLKPEDDSIDCSFCEEVISGLGYSCPKSRCDFHLHKSCFELAKEIRHKSHPKHALTLRSTATDYYTQFKCNACRNIIEGFMYHCAKCDVSLHIKCASLIETVKRKDHEHQLKLFYSSQLESFFFCAACKGVASDDGWTYFCKECDHGIHVDCVNYEDESPDGDNSDGKSDEASQVDEESDPDEESPDGENSDEKSDVASQVDDESDQVKTGGIMHFSHRHALCLVNLEAEEDSTQCSACEEVISGSRYSCTKSRCDFHLDKSCFQLAEKIQHKSHPEHPLTLVSCPYDDRAGQIICSACQNDGTGFTYHCETCQFNLHIQCASSLETVKRDDHDHPLKLFYSCPNKELGYSCDVCHGTIQEDCWAYYCDECDNSYHVYCVNDEEQESSSTGNPILDAQMHMQRLQFQVEMSRQNAQFVINCGQSMLNLV